MEPEPDPAIFITDPQESQQKTNFSLKLFFILLFEGTGTFT
jgi:hypothetical protein